MNSQRPLIILILGTVFMTGCDRQSRDASSAPPVPSAVSSNSNVASPAVESLPGAPALTEESLKAFEQKYSCRLPEDYRAFLLKNNGAFPVLDCVVFQEAGRKTESNVFCFLAIGDKRPWASLDWNYENYSRRLPKSTFPIARDSCGNLWLISVRSDNGGSVFFWDHGSYDTFKETELENWPLVAASFQKFLDHLGSSDASAEDGVVPSRYSLVNQAAAGMVNKNPGFSTRANPGFVWHCDCNEEGHIKMQFVKYEIHAATTHTCGYARLCAIKGLIKSGQPRLPY